MTDKSSYFEKPYRYNHKIDEKTIIDIFNIVGNLNINDLKIKMLIEQIPYNIVDSNGNTLYHKVLIDDDVLKTENQRLQMIKFLYNENCNPDSPNNMNITPFHLACMKQYKTIIDFLISINVNVNYKDNYGNTPLHKLLIGNIKLEEKTNIGKLFPVAPKMFDTKSFNNIKALKQRIWDDIKDSPFIRLIDETLKYNIDILNNDDIEIIKSYIDKLVSTNLDNNKQDKISKITEVGNIGINKFKNIIEKQWGNFALISDIELHNITNSSYPKDDPSQIGIIKFRNYKKYLFEKINNSIKDLIESLTFQITYGNIAINQINTSLLDLFISNNAQYLMNNGYKLELNDIYNDNYIQYNNSILPNNLANDFADNVIDLTNNTFIGGARNITIIDEIDYNLFKKPIDDIIPTLVYTLILDFNKAMTFNYQLKTELYERGNPEDELTDFSIYINNENNQITTFYNNFVHFITCVIQNKYYNIEQNIINIINSNEDYNEAIHNNFMPISNFLSKSDIYNIEYTEKIKHIYYLMNLFLCCKKMLENNNTDNLNIEMNIGCIILIAGLINNKKDLNISLQQCCKPLLLKQIINNNKFGFFIDINNNFNSFNKSYFILLTYIYILLSTESISDIIDTINLDIEINDIADITDIVNEFIDSKEELSNILDNLYNFMKNDISNREYSNMIINYYNQMENPPQELHLADLISIITTDEINYDYLFERLSNLLIDYIDIDFDKNITNYKFNFNKNKFAVFLNDNILAKELKIVNELALPSRINYYMYKTTIDDNDIFENNKNNPEYFNVYKRKFIESYYLGLNFMGILRNIKYYPNRQVEINNANVNFTTDINLYNFSTNGYDQNTFNTNNYRLSDGNNDINVFRPTLFYSVANLYNNYFIYIGNILNKCLEYLKITFTEFLESHSSAKYMTMVSNIYPVLLNLLNQSNLIYKYKNNFMNKYKDIFNNLNSIFNVENEFDKYNLINQNTQAFNIKKFEKLINNINGLIFMLYYVSDSEKVKIPKLLYYSLGKNPLIAYDDTQPINIINTTSASTNDINTNTKYADLFNNYKYSNIFFKNVIKNNLFLSKNIILNEYHANRNEKLPPSLNDLFYEFYKINVIKIIIDKLDRDVNDDIENNIIKIPTNENIKNIQLKYIKAKIIEELLRFYFKNRVIKHSIDKYNKYLGDKIAKEINVEQLFKYNEINYGVGQTDYLLKYSQNILNNNDIIKFFYNFSKPNNVKQQFYIYPDNYFSTTRLNNKLVVSINKDIIELLLENGADVLLYNNEKISPLVMILKNYFYDCIEIIKNHVDLRIFGDKEEYSPFNYLLKTFHLHLGNYNNFIYNQYNDIVQIIQANENFYNNIPKYLEVSFNIVKFITEQYLTENVNINIDDFCDSLDINYNFDKFPYIKTNNIYKTDAFLIFNELKEKFNLETLNLEVEYHNNLTSNNSPNLMNRYNAFINDSEGINSNYLSYLDGWEKFFNNNDNYNYSYSLPKLLVDYQLNMTDIKSTLFNTKVIKLLDFYRNNNVLVKDYFEKPRYTTNNNILLFVYELLLHMTRTFICSTIENIIKKVLFEYLNNIQTDSANYILDEINYIFDPIKEYLYETIPEIFVSNSVNIYIDESLSREVQSVSTVLNNFLDLLKTSSPIDIDEYTINLLKNNFIMYFDTIVWKTINNWNVVIENIFMFHINQYRILECMNKVIN